YDSIIQSFARHSFDSSRLCKPCCRPAKPVIQNRPLCKSRNGEAEDSRSLARGASQRPHRSFEKLWTRQRRTSGRGQTGNHFSVWLDRKTIYGGGGDDSG